MFFTTLSNKESLPRPSHSFYLLPNSKLQQFKPDYTAPPPLIHYGGIPMNFRGNWEISRRDLLNSQFIAMVNPDHEYSDADFDEYHPPSSTNLICCRIVAIIVISLSLCVCVLANSFVHSQIFQFLCHSNLYMQFMVLLVLRHTLPIIITGGGEYSVTLFTLLMLKTIGILLPIYVMVRAFTAIQSRRLRQDFRSYVATSDEENDL